MLFIFSLTLVISLALYLFIVFSKSNLKRPALLVSFISLIFTFTLYFQSTGLERFKYIETYIYLENFFLDSEESRHLKRGKLFIKLKEYLETKKASKNELYLLKNRLNSINEFDLSALVLEELLNDPAGLPKALFSEYTQILFLPISMALYLMKVMLDLYIITLIILNRKLIFTISICGILQQLKTR